MLITGFLAHRSTYCANQTISDADVVHLSTFVSSFMDQNIEKTTPKIDKYQPLGWAPIHTSWYVMLWHHFEVLAFYTKYMNWNSYVVDLVRLLYTGVDQR